VRSNPHFGGSADAPPADAARCGSPVHCAAQEKLGASVARGIAGLLIGEASFRFLLDNVAMLSEVEERL
jgi:hypothetical protein